MPRTKKYEVIYLGDKNVCLEKKDNTINERVDNCNELIAVIASCSRGVFRRDKHVASFISIGMELLYYDHYTGDAVRNTHSENKYEWGGKVNGGGTMQDIVMCMSNYILTGIPFFYTWLRNDGWGYSEEEKEKIKSFGIEKGIFTTNTRYRFWSHNKENEKEVVDTFIETHKIDRDKCIIVRVQGDAEAPDFVSEFNFYHAKSIV